MEQTRAHVERLEEVFEELGKTAKGKTCQAMKGLLEEGAEIMSEKMEPHVMDAALIAAAQKGRALRDRQLRDRPHLG